jgi:hypothetical protein
MSLVRIWLVAIPSPGVMIVCALTWICVNKNRPVRGQLVSQKAHVIPKTSLHEPLVPWLDASEELKASRLGSHLR